MKIICGKCTQLEPGTHCNRLLQGCQLARLKVHEVNLIVAACLNVFLHFNPKIVKYQNKAKVTSAPMTSDNRVGK